LLNPGKSALKNLTPEQRATAVRRGFTLSAERRAHMSAVAKQRGFRPPVRGGNGKGMTNAEAALVSLLPPNWIWNFPIALGSRQRGYPTNYKVDFAWPAKKIALEVDGNSHKTHIGKARDTKKTTKLSELGWIVLRIQNQEVTNSCTTSKLVEHLTTLLEADI